MRAQVWGGATASRHPSSSSATSIPESSASHPDAGYRSNMGEGWGSRSVSGTWDEMADAQQKDLSNLVRWGLRLRPLAAIYAYFAAQY